MTATDWPLDLDPIRERVEAATPGPWEPAGHFHTAGCRCVSCYEYTVGWMVDHPGALVCEGLAAKRAAAGETNDFCQPLASCDQGPLLSWADALFACEARADVPALIVEVERLRAHVDGLHCKVQSRMAVWSRADESPYTTGQVDALDWVLQRLDEIKEQL